MFYIIAKIKIDTIFNYAKAESKSIGGIFVMPQTKVSKQKVLELLQEIAEKIQSGQSNWMRIADLFVQFMVEHPKSETTKSFVDWLRFEAQDWLDEDASWTPFFEVPARKDKMLKFISDWVAENDVPKFMEWLSKKDEDLYWFLTSSRYKGNDWYEL